MTIANFDHRDHPTAGLVLILPFTRPWLWLLSLTGVPIFTLSRESFWKRLLAWILYGWAAVLLLNELMRVSATISHTFDDVRILTSSDLLAFMTALGGAVTAGLLLPCLTWSFWRLVSHVEVLDSVCGKYLTPSDRKILLGINAVSASCAVVYVVDAVFVTLNSKRVEPTVENFIFRTAKASRGTRRIIAFLVVGLSTFVEICTVLCKLCIGVLACAVGLAFRHVFNCAERRAILIESTESKLDGDKVTSDHFELRRLVQMLDDRIGYAMFLLHLNDIFWILYSVMRSQEKTGYYLHIYGATTVVTHVWYSVAAVFLHEMAHRMEDLYQYILERASGPVQLQWFFRLYSLHNGPVGLTVAGIATIDRYFVISVLGLLITYILVTYDQRGSDFTTNVLERTYGNSTL